MLSQKSKKGFAMVEAICSIMIFTVLFIGALEIVSYCIKLKEVNKHDEDMILLMNSLKNVLEYDYDFDHLKELYDNNKLYISNESLNYGCFKGNSIVFLNMEPQKEPFVKLNITYDEILTVNIEFHSKFLNKEEIRRCTFYKGDY